MAGNNLLRRTSLSIPAISGMALLIAVNSCAPVADGPLGSRVLPEEKRYEFLQTNGSEMTPEVRNAFREGEVVRGMAREWVLQLYGRPDRSTDRSWEYLDRKGNPVMEMFFESDTVDSVITIIRQQ